MGQPVPGEEALKCSHARNERPSAGPSLGLKRPGPTEDSTTKESRFRTSHPRLHTSKETARPLSCGGGTNKKSTPAERSTVEQSTCARAIAQLNRALGDASEDLATAIAKAFVAEHSP